MGKHLFILIANSFHTTSTRSNVDIAGPAHMAYAPSTPTIDPAIFELKRQRDFFVCCSVLRLRSEDTWSKPDPAGHYRRLGVGPRLRCTHGHKGLGGLASTNTRRGDGHGQVSDTCTRYSTAFPSPWCYNRKLIASARELGNRDRCCLFCCHIMEILFCVRVRSRAITCTCRVLLLGALTIHVGFVE